MARLGAERVFNAVTADAETNLIFCRIKEFSNIEFGMRYTERLQNQLTSAPIEQIELDLQCGGDTTEFLRSLKSLYADAHSREQPFDLQQEKLCVDVDHRLGRPGMNLWASRCWRQSMS